jgi:hypothetical protein
MPDIEASGCPSDCPEEDKFVRFFEDMKHLLITTEDNRGAENAEAYHRILANRIYVSNFEHIHLIYYACCGSINFIKNILINLITASM